MPGARLPLLLVVAWGLRIALVLRGGQAFFQDEMRYFRSVHLLDQLLWYGDAGWALDELLSSPEHIGFAWLGVVPELFRTAGLRLRGLPNTAALTDALLWIPAIVLSLASVGCIGLAYLIARAEVRQDRVACRLAQLVRAARPPRAGRGVCPRRQADHAHRGPRGAVMCMPFLLSRSSAVPPR